VLSSILDYYTGEPSFSQDVTISSYTPCLLGALSNADNFTVHCCVIYFTPLSSSWKTVSACREKQRSKYEMKTCFYIVHIG
jgi:hypothetical protein